MAKVMEQIRREDRERIRVEGRARMAIIELEEKVESRLERLEKELVMMREICMEKEIRIRRLERTVLEWRLSEEGIH